ncbi:MAG: cytochrome P450 [Rivularia sp. (in: Bacteria)]|nr:cytochrome P450 [Rivularia sp. MS3]
MPQIPRDKNLDSTLALLSEGYNFISKRCQRYDSDIFITRLLLQENICMRGEEAAKIFYDTNRFIRKGATPKRAQKTLLGEGGVQGLDGDEHRQRKQMLMSLMNAEKIGQLAAITSDMWGIYIKKWENMDKVVLFPEVREILSRAVCNWAGVPLTESEIEQKTKDFGAMIDSPAAIGLQHWQGRLARQRAEQWLGNIIDNVRKNKLEVDKQSALYVIATHRNLQGELLDKRIAAVDLLNVLRPTVAIARYIIFAALALHEHPECRQQLQADEDNYIELFVQEVRRFYPFFPFVAARVKQEFDWKGYRFSKGMRVILDLYGTNHDARLWKQPQQFQPERFRNWDGSAFNFIPQGGGDYHQNHRCAGEWITIAIMKAILKLMSANMRYDVPEQDLQFSLSTMPTIPKSRFLISNVKLVQ